MYMYINYICRSEVGTVFSLSWLITWFGHVLGDLDSIVRLYDFFMASAPLMPIYMAASVSIYTSIHTRHNDLQGINFFLHEVEFFFHRVLVSLKPYFHCNLVSKIFGFFFVFLNDY